MNVDTPARSLLVAAGIALACSVLVASAVSLLRPLQGGDELLERGAAILDAAGRLPPNAAADSEVLSRFLALDARVLTLGTTELNLADDAHSLDHWQRPENGSLPAALPARVPVYIARSNGRPERIVFPVHGAGMWSTIYGYLALAPDLTTIVDIVFLSHGETPGVGDRIEEPAWRKAWQGKQLFDAAGTPRIRVVREARDEFEVDLISGASVTCEAVGEFIRASFGDAGYGPLVKRLQREGVPE